MRIFNTISVGRFWTCRLIVAVEPILSPDIIHECLQHGVPVGENRRIREVLAHLLLYFRDSLVFWVALGPFATGMDGVER